MDLATAKSEALDKKSYNAKRRRQRRRTLKNSNRCNWQKATLHVQHTFFVDFSAVVLDTCNYNVKVMLHGTIRNVDF